MILLHQAGYFLDHLFPIVAVFAVSARTGDLVGEQALLSGQELSVNPGVVALVGDDRHVKFEPAVEFGSVFGGVGENKVAGVVDREAQEAKKILIELHLALVGLLILSSS